jgi:formylglycine-generating enzyme required for sulfatase activity
LEASLPKAPVNTPDITNKDEPIDESLKQKTLKTESFEFEIAILSPKGTGKGKTYEIERSRGSAKCFRENLGNGVVLEMVAIPGGQFLMGSPENELGRRTTESPQHSVMIQPFFMSRYQITQEQYEQVMGTNPSRFQGAKKPVERVSWNHVVEFCDKLSKISGGNYRLPSEAEWEYACRAGTTTPFHFGETITTDLANYRGTDYEELKSSGSYGEGLKGIYREKTTEVGSFGAANNFGLYDMHGNVWEWCQDVWHGSYKGAPIDGSARMNDSDNEYRVLRGGSWFHVAGDCRSASRNGYARDSTFNFLHLGFRVVLSGVART